MEEENVKKELEKILKDFSIEGTELEKIYLKVLENFPEIKKEDLKLVRLPFYNPAYACLLMVNPIKFMYNNEVVVDPMIILGDKFLESDEQEKEAMLAHELGHYSRYKRYSIHKIRQTVKRNTLVKEYDNAFTEIVTIIDPKIGHMVKRLRKWNMLQELYADKRAAGTRYGKGMVKLLEKHYSQYYEMLQSTQREEIETRIRNLKKLLGEKDDR